MKTRIQNTQVSQTKHQSMVVLALLVGSLSQSLGQSPPPMVTLAASDFEADAEGWRGTNDANGAETLTFNTGGAASNSVGYISVSESQGDSDTMFFSAPAKFLGDKRAAYNGLLRFQLKQSATSSLNGAYRFVLLGSSNLVLSLDLGAFPGTSWQVFEVPLNENAGWHVASIDMKQSSNQLATRDDVVTVLRSLTSLWIKAEFSTHNFDRSDLDDVMLLGQPSGATQPSLAAATYAGITINGSVGTSYRIEYRDAFGSASVWQSLADVVLPCSPYLFFDTNSPGSPRRFYRAVLLAP
jgi:hypothetical protein